ncbi:hypothetical protein MMC12_007755 [Toensbergia leucococca]|nr:hypothetical protein [Toensbergia leucococca]
MDSGGRIDVGRVRSAEDISATACLFRAYVDSLGINLAFQDFEAEMESFPGKYAPPGGELLLARDENGTPVGCVGLRPLKIQRSQRCCEGKRLYILPEKRGLGIGKKLIKAMLDVAAGLGYHEVVLDTLPSMAQGISLYKNAGFVPTAPYYYTPLAGTIFLSRKLRSSSL